MPTRTWLHGIACTRVGPITHLRVLDLLRLVELLLELERVLVKVLLQHLVRVVDAQLPPRKKCLRKRGGYRASLEGPRRGRAKGGVTSTGSHSCMAPDMPSAMPMQHRSCSSMQLVELEGALGLELLHHLGRGIDAQS